MAQLAVRLTAILPLTVLSGLSLGGIRKTPLRQGDPAFLPLRIGIAMAIAADVGVLLGLVLHTADCWGRPAGYWGEALFAGGCLLGAAALFLWPVSLFPEESGALLLADRTQQRRFTACLGRLLAGFLFYGGWLAFLFCCIPLDSPGQDGAALAFATAALLGQLWSGRQSIRAAYERLETLIDKQYQAELISFMQVIRSQRHDFNFHMQAVAGMIENRRYDECGAYVREMVRSVERLNDVLPLDNPVIGAQVNAFQELSAAQGIRLEVQALSQMENLPCTVYEANTILGNLLQNAIDEVESRGADGRWIRLLLMKRSRRHIIKVSNPCDKGPEDFADIFHMGYSTKQQHEGIGLVTVRKIAAKYGGTVYLEHDPGVVHFIVKLPEKAEA